MPRLDSYTSAKNLDNPVVREYDVRGTRFVASATVSPSAIEDAVVKIRRLIRGAIAQPIAGFSQ